MWYPIFKRIFSSAAAGGGVRGKDAGTVHGITTRAGFITEAYPLFTDTFRPAGGRVIESANGKDILGSSTASIIKICKETGADGKKTNIGKRKITGG